VQDVHVGRRVAAVVDRMRCVHPGSNPKHLALRDRWLEDVVAGTASSSATAVRCGRWTPSTCVFADLTPVRPGQPPPPVERLARFFD
jgi:hypothetical protein